MIEVLKAILILGCLTGIIPVCVWHIGKGIVEEVRAWLSL